MFAGIARVQCGCSAGRAARPAVQCRFRLYVCGAGGMRVARNRCGRGPTPSAAGQVRVRTFYPRRALDYAPLTVERP